MQSRPIIIGNWKMHKTIQESCAFVKHLLPAIEDLSAQVGLAIPFTAIRHIAELVQKEKASLWIGAQNLSNKPLGAYTGEIAACMLKEAGAQFVLIGHSERRHLFHESFDEIADKVKRALEEGLSPIFCVGETAEQKEQGLQVKVLTKQLLGSLQGLQKSQMDKIIVAYEPVWAIGTGNVAKPTDAAQAHAIIRKCLDQHWSIGSKVKILYGGSVKPDNAHGLIQEKDIDGFLVGGASLENHLFEQIITQVCS